MTAEEMIANVLGKLAVNATLRAETMKGLEEALLVFDEAKQQEATAASLQRLAVVDIATMRERLGALEAQEAAHVADLKTLQGLLAPAPTAEAVAKE